VRDTWLTRRATCSWDTSFGHVNPKLAEPLWASCILRITLVLSVSASFSWKHSVNFREHSVNFREHSVNFREHSVNFREYSVNFREHSVNFREHSGMGADSHPLQLNQYSRDPELSMHEEPHTVGTLIYLCMRNLIL
jgi:hypothetical protein